tara:strand:+ start:217 stop:420 length:204 start_codon:yes stop_codon:yes gene_type:complete
MRRTILDAVRAHAQGHIAKAKANVEVYLKNPTGIGEHSDVLAAVHEQLDIMSTHHDRLEVLDQYFED